jgi:hypothetical protein
MALTGQVVDANLTDGVLKEIPVVLFCKGDNGLENTTNPFGEFNVSFNAIGRLGVRLRMKKFALLLLLPECLVGNSMSQHNRASPHPKSHVRMCAFRGAFQDLPWIPLTSTLRAAIASGYE